MRCSGTGVLNNPHPCIRLVDARGLYKRQHGVLHFLQSRTVLRRIEAVPFSIRIIRTAGIHADIIAGGPPIPAIIATSLQITVDDLLICPIPINHIIAVVTRIADIIVVVGRIHVIVHAIGYIQNEYNIKRHGLRPCLSRQCNGIHQVTLRITARRVDGFVDNDLVPYVLARWVRRRSAAAGAQPKRRVKLAALLIHRTPEAELSRQHLVRLAAVGDQGGPVIGRHLQYPVNRQAANLLRCQLVQILGKQHRIGTHIHQIPHEVSICISGNFFVP